MVKLYGRHCTIRLTVVFTDLSQKRISRPVSESSPLRRENARDGGASCDPRTNSQRKMTRSTTVTTCRIMNPSSPNLTRNKRLEHALLFPVSTMEMNIQTHEEIKIYQNRPSKSREGVGTHFDLPTALSPRHITLTRRLPSASALE